MIRDNECFRSVSSDFEVVPLRPIQFYEAHSNYRSRTFIVVAYHLFT